MCDKCKAEMGSMLDTIKVYTEYVGTDTPTKQQTRAVVLRLIGLSRDATDDDIREYYNSNQQAIFASYTETLLPFVGYAMIGASKDSVSASAQLSVTTMLAKWYIDTQLDQS